MKKKIVLIGILGCIIIAAYIFIFRKTAPEIIEGSWDFTVHNGEEAKLGKNNHHSNLGFYEPVIKSSHRLVTFLDKSNGKNTVVCDQAHCWHISDTCPAYLSDSVSSLFCYNGSLFYLSRNSNMSWNLYRMDEDCHKKTRLMEICNLNEAHSAQLIGIDRDMLYYSERSSEKEIIYKLDMKTLEKVIVIDADTINETLGNFIFTEDKLYFSKRINGSDGTKESMIYGFDLYSYETTSVYNGEYVNSYTIYKGNLIIGTETGVKIVDVATQKTDVYIDNIRFPQVTSDDNYLYIDNYQVTSKEKTPRSLQIIDKQMRVVNKIDLSNNKNHIFNYLDTMLFTSSVDSFEYILKADILKPDAAFVKSTSVK